MAVQMPYEQASDLMSAHIESERFIATVMAISGRSENRANILLRRIHKLAAKSIKSTHEYQMLWKQRTCEGWRYSHRRR